MISHQHRCIFIHIPKTGGTSIEKLLWPPKRERTAADLWMGFVDEYHNKYQTGGLQHLLAYQVRREVGAAVFGEYFKFTIVRNPWDRAVSQFIMARDHQRLRDFVGMKPSDPFKRYLELTRTRKHVQWEEQAAFIHDAEGGLLVDYVGRFEHFEASVRSILGRIGVSAAAIPHERASVRGRYQDYYDDESRAMVDDACAADIATFGYSFDGP